MKHSRMTRWMVDVSPRTFLFVFFFSGNRRTHINLRRRRLDIFKLRLRHPRQLGHLAVDLAPRVHMSIQHLCELLLRPYLVIRIIAYGMMYQHPFLLHLSRRLAHNMNHLDLLAVGAGDTVEGAELTCAAS